jgi:hypothetical protein
MGNVSNIRDMVSERVANERIKVYNSNRLRSLDEYTGRRSRSSVRWDKISSIDNGMISVMGTIALNNKSYVEMHSGEIFSEFKKMLRFIIRGKRKEW